MILKHWFDEVWNRGNEAAIDELLAPDAIIHNLMDGDGEKVTDIATFKKMFHTVRSSLSDVNVTVEYELSDGVMCAAHCLITAVHTGEGFGRTPRSTPVYFTGICMARIRNQQIVECWNYFDFESMYQQME